MSANAVSAKAVSAKAIPPVPAVTPIVDYEPPAFGGPPDPPPVSAPRPRRTALRSVQPSPTEQARARAAAAFAEAALRRVLEVIDRRRPPGQIRPLLAAGLLDSLPAGAVGDGAARLRRVVAQISDSRGTAAEVAASYSRGGRFGAIACRIEMLGTPSEPRWQLVALHIG